jgi:protein phosphatase
VRVSIPDPCLVVLIGASGSGKSSLAQRHFRPTEVVSSDLCRAMVGDDERALDADADAFAVVHLIARTRLGRGLITAIDATNLHGESRRALRALARDHHCAAVAVVLDLPEALCQERNRSRGDRGVLAHVVRLQLRLLRRAIGELGAEGFDQVVILRSPEEVDALAVERRGWDTG